MAKDQPEKKGEEKAVDLHDELRRLLQAGQLAYTRRSFNEAKRVLNKGRIMAERAGLGEDAAVFKGAILILDKETEILDTLKRLLHQARSAYIRRKRGEAKRLYSEGNRTANEAGWKEDAAVFTASILVMEKRYAEAVEELESLVKSRNISLLGYAYDLLGQAQAGAGKFKEAINLFQSALDDPDYDAAGKTWSNMGEVYLKRNEFDKAIRCFQEALESSDYDTPGFAYNAMGRSYLEKSNCEEALRCFRKALDSSDSHDRGDTWDGMGVAYLKSGKFDKAIECYREALSFVDYETPGHAWFNMGMAYLRKEELDSAQNYLNKAQKWYKDNEPSRLDRVEYFLTELKQRLTLRKRGAAKGEGSQKPQVDAEDPVRRIMEILSDNRKKIAEYAIMSGTGYKDILAVLKGWSSFVPVELYVDYKRFGKHFHRGGGYFIKAGEEGLVIDPGLDFLMNFASEGFHIKEVRHVLVSRDHIEHSANLTSIANLENQWRLHDLSTKSKMGIQFHLNLDTEKSYNPVLVDLGVNPKYIRKVDPNQGSYFMGGAAELDVFPAKLSPEPNTVGCVLNLRLEDGERRRIGYVSETDFFEGTPQQLRGCEVIMVHFSVSAPRPSKEAVSGDELAYAELERLLRETTGSDILTAHFAGGAGMQATPYTGLERLIAETDARLYVVSKFWGNTGDYRIEFVEKLIYDFKKRGREVKIIPGDVGCMVNLSDLTIRCSNCGAFVPYSEISFTKPEGDFGKLAYVCKRCSG
ncbi:tetratricopeptide repeat protein [candidate division WOR-3 bacterium]|nr:tetratricopeptide repeat protein [candidate division WOR-3 bacterium]